MKNKRTKMFHKTERPVALTSNNCPYRCTHTHTNTKHKAKRNKANEQSK